MNIGVVHVRVLSVPQWEYAICERTGNFGRIGRFLVNVFGAVVMNCDCPGSHFHGVCLELNWLASSSTSLQVHPHHTAVLKSAVYFVYNTYSQAILSFIFMFGWMRAFGLDALHDVLQHCLVFVLQ